ncbi:hypothetical protein FVA77_24885 [Phyllobacterium endophyticum]|nr:hypothetical protein FVA77_24885 [Phyllobacterium endophyticum]
MEEKTDVVKFIADANKAVTGITTAVTGTEPKKLVTDGGNPTPLVDPHSQIIPLGRAKTARFTEIAPNTTDGDTFVPSKEIDYNLGNLVSVSNNEMPKDNGPRRAKDNKLFIAPIKGWIRYPVAAKSLNAKSGRFPVIVFEHGMGNHETSYRGYDYLSEELASHGYVVVSIHGGKNNAMGDSSGLSRGQLILGTLDRLRQIDSNGQIDSDGKPGDLNTLLGKLDFTRVGIMGHSRGGQGVSMASKLNLTRIGTSKDELIDALVASPSRFEEYPDLAAAVTPEIKYQAAIEAKPEVIDPAAVDDGKFSAVIDKYKPVIAGINLENIKKLLILNPSAFEAVFPGLAGTVTQGVTHPAVEAKPEIKAVAASFDMKKFDAALKNYNIYYAANREKVPPYDFKGAFMLAPTDFDGNLGLNNVPLANLLPSCDGDMSDLEGAIAYDHNRFGPASDTAPRYQIMVLGANHDFYNRSWGDDGEWSNPQYCTDERPGSVRLSRPDQERNGLFLINSFMRYHVGGEQKFAAYWNGHAQLPKEACQVGKDSCDERVLLTIQKSARESKLIGRFEKHESLKHNLLSGRIAFTGFDHLAQCEMPYGKYGTVGGCSPNRLEGFEYRSRGGKGLLSIADHAELAWSKSNAAITTDITGMSAKDLDSLTFRVAVVHPVGQEIIATLTDGSGKRATVTASDFSNALYNSPRLKGESRPLIDHPDDAYWATKKELPILMNMVAIPLAAFEGVDTNNLKELKLVFPKESGKVAITDIELQNLGRDKPAQKLAGK